MHYVLLAVSMNNFIQSQFCVYRSYETVIEKRHKGEKEEEVAAGNCQLSNSRSVYIVETAVTRTM